VVRFGAVIGLVIAATGAWCVAMRQSGNWWIPAVALALLAALGVYGVARRKHAVLRNYPVLGHLRYLMEAIRPELQQYFVERNVDGRPFDRDVRALIYARAKGNTFISAMRYGRRQSGPPMRTRKGSGDESSGAME